MQQVKPQRDVQKKRKQSGPAADEPESKINKTDNTASEATQGIQHALDLLEINNVKIAVVKTNSTNPS